MMKQTEKMESCEKGSLYDKKRWGLPTEAVADLAERLVRIWFMAETKLDFQKLHPRDEMLRSQLELEQLPGLSLANIREMLKAVLPLEQLTPQQAVQLVIKHLVARASATRCRLKQQQSIEPQGNSP